MKRIKAIMIPCAISLWSMTAAAQSIDYLQVHKTDGAAASFALDNLQRISFTDSDIVVEPVATAPQPFAFTAVQNLTFEDGPTAMLTLSSSSTIWFNPQSKEVVIESSNPIGNVAILDLVGRTLTTTPVRFEGQEARINVSHLPAGVYIVKTACGVKKLTINY